MQKLSIIPLMALAVVFSVADLTSADASQMPMPCGMDGRWNPRTQSCERMRPQAGPCRPDQFGCAARSQPRCNGIRYDPACDAGGRWPVGRR
jgi:hypothetical protein